MPVGESKVIVKNGSVKWQMSTPAWPSGVQNPSATPASNQRIISTSRMPDCAIDDHSVGIMRRKLAEWRNEGGGASLPDKRPLDPIRRTAQSNPARDLIAPFVAESSHASYFAALAVAAFAAIAVLAATGGTAGAWDPGISRQPSAKIRPSW